MQKIHNSTQVVTLSPASPDVSLTGTIIAYGPVGTYSVYYEDGRMAVTINAAVIGPAVQKFTVQNAATIIANGEGELGFGVVLGRAGTLSNTGTIISGTGVAILGTASGGDVANSQFIYGSVSAGIYLQAAGTVANAVRGTIIGEVNGIDLYGGGSIQNDGVIRAGDSAIYLHAGGTIYNAGTIDTSRNGIFSAAGDTVVDNAVGGQIDGPANKGGAVVVSAGSVQNAGRIAGYYGVMFDGAGTVTNTGGIAGGWIGVELKSGGLVQNSGTITGENFGVDLFLGGSLKNTGSLYGGTAGVYDFTAATIDNQAGGQITGYEFGMRLTAFAGTVYNAGFVHGFVGIYGGGTILNHGSVSGTRTGIDLLSGTLINAGTIAGGLDGIVVSGAGTIVDSGTILGGSADAIDFQNSLSGRLVLQPGAKITGNVDLDGGILELSAGAKKAETVAIGHGFENIGTILVDKHAVWDLTGTASLGAIVNDGTILAAKSARLSIGGNLAGNGLIKLGHLPLILDGAVAAGQTIGFTGAGDVLDLGAAAEFAGHVKNFAAGETIDLTGVSASAIIGSAFSAGVLTLAASGGDYMISFAGTTGFGGDTLAAFADGDGTGITLAAPAKMAFANPDATPARRAGDTKSWAPHAPVPGHVAPMKAGILTASISASGWVARDLAGREESGPPPYLTLQSGSG